MKCHVCGKKEATVQIKQDIGGETKELWLCSSCAKFAGIELQDPSSIANFFVMSGEQSSSKQVDEKNKKCGLCGMSLRDFRKISRLGCPECYVSFESEIDEILERIQDGEKHVGRVPAKKEQNFKIMALEDELSNAVNSQDFEKAAEIRDKIKNLKNKFTLQENRDEENRDK